MATVAERFAFREPRPDVLSGTPRAGFVDRWIYVFTAGLFVVIILTGFIPDSVTKIAAVQSGARPPFPIVLHMHAVLMASFLLLLLTQTVLMATGRRDLHMRVGVAAFVVAPALVLVGLVLVPTMYHETSNALAAAGPEARANLQQALLRKDNVTLLQLRIGLFFPLFLLVGLRARGINAGLHKRMMILASAMPLAAGLDRITWLPNTFPASAVASDLYILAAVSPMFIWDVVRNRRVHEAYLVWLGVNVPVALMLYTVWDKPWWHTTVQRLMGV
jgi:hypothetical protein